jgi:predicted nucleotidyltransferase
MTDLTDDEQRIIDHLGEGLSRGQQYFRSKNIAEQLGLSAKQVGVRLSKLADDADDDSDVDIDIEKWGRARSTTWRVTSV